jgi:hypothetical protein
MILSERDLRIGAKQGRVELPVVPVPALGHECRALNDPTGAAVCRAEYLPLHVQCDSQMVLGTPRPKQRAQLPHGYRRHAHRERQAFRPHSLSLALYVDIDDEQYARNASPEPTTEPDHGGAYLGEMIKQQHAAAPVRGVPHSGPSRSSGYSLGVHCGIGAFQGARNVIQARSGPSGPTGGVRFGKTSMQLRHESGLATTARAVEDQVLTAPQAIEQFRAEFANTTAHVHRFSATR